MDNRETAKMLKLLKMQAIEYRKNTVVMDVTKESFEFVIDSAVKILDDIESFSLYRLTEREGKWLLHSEHLPCGVALECSECHALYDIPYHYCPKCGCRNREVDEING